MGFFTKFGDGAADMLPLAGLTKRRVRAIAKHMGAPSGLVLMVPIADLESDLSLRPDEEVYGVTYDHIDNLLEGKVIALTARQRILKTYFRADTNALCPWRRSTKCEVREPRHP